MFICKYCGKKCKNNNAFKQHECRCPSNPNRIISKVNTDKFLCPICNKEYFISEKNKHLTYHKNHPDDYRNKIHDFNTKLDNLFCSFCGKQCETKNSLMNHERFCKNNPNKELPYFATHKKTKPVWNKGLTKETDIRIANGAKKIVKSLTGRKTRPHTEEEKEKLRQIALKNHLGGFNMRKAGVYYNGIKLDSSYEVTLAKDLDKNNIKWIRPSSFSYNMKGKIHQYTPDFYLPDYDIYLDPKNDFLINNINPHLGYSDIDKIKEVEIENNIKVLVLDKTQLSWESIQQILSQN